MSAETEWSALHTRIENDWKAVEVRYCCRSMIVNSNSLVNRNKDKVNSDHAALIHNNTTKQQRWQLLQSFFFLNLGIGLVFIFQAWFWCMSKFWIRDACIIFSMPACFWFWLFIVFDFMFYICSWSFCSCCIILCLFRHSCYCCSYHLAVLLFFQIKHSLP